MSKVQMATLHDQKIFSCHESVPSSFSTHLSVYGSAHFSLTIFSDFIFGYKRFCSFWLLLFSNLLLPRKWVRCLPTRMFCIVSVCVYTQHDLAYSAVWTVLISTIRWKSLSKGFYGHYKAICPVIARNHSLQPSSFPFVQMDGRVERYQSMSDSIFRSRQGYDWLLDIIYSVCFQVCLSWASSNA